MRQALALAGREDVAVAAGADVASGVYRVRPGLPDLRGDVPAERLYWPQAVAPAPGPVDEALALLEHSIEQGAIIVAIGPYSNLALLEKRRPGILGQAWLTLMGGYIFPPRPGFPAWDHTFDWNVQVDVAAAAYVFERANPTLVPLAVTVETALRRAYLPALRAASPLARLIARQAEAFARDEGYEEKLGRSCDALPDDTINFQHDALACAIALGWRGGVEIQELPLLVKVENGWLRPTVDNSGRPTRVVTAVDGERFSALWLDTVLGGSGENARTPGRQDAK